MFSLSTSALLGFLCGGGVDRFRARGSSFFLVSLVKDGHRAAFGILLALGVCSLLLSHAIFSAAVLSSSHLWMSASTIDGGRSSFLSGGGRSLGRLRPWTNLDLGGLDLDLTPARDGHRLGMSLTLRLDLGGLADVLIGDGGLVDIGVSSPRSGQMSAAGSASLLWCSTSGGGGLLSDVVTRVWLWAGFCGPRPITISASSFVIKLCAGSGIGTVLQLLGHGDAPTRDIIA